MRRTTIILLIILAFAGEAATRRVVIADADGWRTTLALGANAPESVRLTDCTLGAITSVDLVANGSIVLRDAGRVQCDLRNSIGLLPLSFSGIAESRLLFVDRRSGINTSLTVPSLDVPLDAEHRQVRMRLVTNDDVERTFVVVFGRPAPLTLYVQNEHGNLVQIESILKSDFDRLHDFLFYPLKATVGAGTVILTQENSGAPSPNTGSETYYGFAVVGRPDGTTAAVRLWEPAAAPMYSP